MRKRKTEKKLYRMATEMSKNMVDRTENGVCKHRDATIEEQIILHKLFYGALFELNRTVSPDEMLEHSILDTTETIADLFFPNMNGFETVFKPLEQALEEWEREK